MNVVLALIEKTSKFSIVYHLLYSVRFPRSELLYHVLLVHFFVTETNTLLCNHLWSCVVCGNIFVSGYTKSTEPIDLKFDLNVGVKK